MNNNESIGEETTTLDYLFTIYPWLKELIEKKDNEIKELKEELKQSYGWNYSVSEWGK